MTTKPDIIELETIPPDSNITITINTNTYTRIQRILLEGLAFKDFEHFQKCIKEVTAGKHTDPMSEHVLTLIFLCNLIEEAAKKDNLVKKTKYDITAQKIVAE